MSNQNTDQWQLAIGENENYIIEGKGMQQKGAAILNSIHVDGREIDFKSRNVGEIAKLVDAATKAIERGAGLESRARENLRRLYACQPIDWAGQGN